MRLMNRLGLVASALSFAVLLSPRCSAEDLPQRRSVMIFGQRIEYYDVGTGPVVVLLHGLGTSAQVDWGKCIMPLSAHHRVLAPDQLGFGASDKPVIEYSIQTWVDMLGEFLRVEGAKDFTLAGESLGGWIAAQYAIQALGNQASVGPSLRLPCPGRLILVDAAGHKHLAVGSAEGGPGLSLAGSMGLLSAIYMDPSYSTDDAVRAQFARSMSKGDGWTIHSVFSNRTLLNECIDGKLGQITIPTLVVWGAGDKVLPLDDGKDYAANIPGAKLVIIPGSGHAPGIEKPNLLVAAVEAFLGDR
jgi:pimeloyl-ACP methyl ester carboxylesterase